MPIQSTMSRFVPQLIVGLDVILTTSRPQKKNVTGEDVNNSLYYIRLDPPDEGLVSSPPWRDDTAPTRSSSESVRGAIPRKPLPAQQVSGPETTDHFMAVNAIHSLSLSPATSSPVDVGTHPIIYPTIQHPTADTQLRGYRENPMFRKGRSDRTQDTPGQLAGPVPTAAPIHRKPLGAVASTAAAIPPSTGTHSHDASNTLGVNAAQARPATPTRADAYNARVTSPGYSSRQQDRFASPGKVAGRPSSVLFSLTIIRRDPASGSQCNVGQITSFQTNVPTPEHAEPSLDPNNMGNPLAQAQKINIRLHTSGYAKYRDMPTKADIEAAKPPPAGYSFSQQMMRAGHVEVGEAPVQNPPLNSGGQSARIGFTRDVVMTYGGSFSSNFKKAFQRKDPQVSVPGGLAAEPGLAPPEVLAAHTPQHARNGSASTIGSVDSVDGKHRVLLTTAAVPGMRPKGYAFLSPWDGRCEFRTSADGRCLKCRHVLDSANNKIDPSDLANSIRDAHALGRSRGDELTSALVGAKPVSELRFSLPHGNSHRKNLSGQFGKLLQPKRLSSDDDCGDEDEYSFGNTTGPMDLSLGREHAGGGTRGKRAKLGKLIIHDEGLKMLDLAVAANVGVWWNSWGRMMQSEDL